jgi:outer membrane protease
MKKLFSAKTSAALDNTKTKSLLGIVLLFSWLIAAISPVYSQEVSKDRLFLKSGRVIECDEAWIASEDIVRCKKGSSEILYSIDDVDLRKTFGEAEAKKIEEERKPLKEKKVLRSMAEMPRSSESYITVGIGKLGGDTTYQIGGTVVTPLGSGQVHFPISELEFPLDVWMVSVEGSKEFAEKWKVSVGVKKNITGDAGKMKDSDWGAYFLDGYAWAEKDTLDIYSESDAELDALIMDINLRYRFYEKPSWAFFAGLGYIHQNFDYEISNLNQWYPSSTYYFGADLPHDFVSGKVLTYEITYSIPYIEIGLQGAFKKNFSVETSIGYSPIVDAEDEDVHILRDRVSEADCEGDAILFSLRARFDFSKNWLVMAEFDYTKIEVDGTSKTYDRGAYSHTIDQEITSEQFFGGFSVGYAF